MFGMVAEVRGLIHKYWLTAAFKMSGVLGGDFGGLPFA
jgi:hypothetical protein